MQLILVAPGLLAQPAQALAAVSALATLARFADAPRVEPRGIAAALADALGMPDAPLAPLAALGAGLDCGTAYTLFADPVFLAADRDDVVLLQRVDDLAAADAGTLAALLNRHFAGEGLEFILARPDAWFARCNGAPDVVLQPFDAARGHGLYAHLPRGADATAWTRRLNEIQMLLHEHPVNVEREARGQNPMSGIWFWGGGTLDMAGRLPTVAAIAGAGRVADLARGIALCSGGTEQPDDAEHPRRALERIVSEARDAPARSAAVVVDAIDREAAVADFASEWVAPGLALFRHRALERVHLVADGNGVAAHWTAAAPTFWQRIAGVAHPKTFAIPAPPA